MLGNADFSSLNISPNDLKKVVNSTSAQYSDDKYYELDKIMVGPLEMTPNLPVPYMSSGTDIMTGFYGNLFNKFEFSNFNTVFSLQDFGAVVRNYMQSSSGFRANLASTLSAFSNTSQTSIYLRLPIASNQTQTQLGQLSVHLPVKLIPAKEI